MTIAARTMKPKVRGVTRRVVRMSAGVTLIAGPPMFFLGCAANGGPEPTRVEASKTAVVEVNPHTSRTFLQAIPSAATGIEMRFVPPAKGSGLNEQGFWISTCEVPWEVFDVFVYSLDDAPTGEPAVTRPSKPYLPPDRGFGHDGYPAIGMSFKAAAEFCAWLSARSGKTFRLPTEREWEYACGGRAQPSDGNEPLAWHRNNAAGTTHPVGKLPANMHGLRDMLGNVSEWVMGTDGAPAIKGGSFRDAPETMTSAWRASPSRAWNASDPQIPKSQWWLADAPFIGFRVLCEAGFAGESR